MESNKNAVLSGMNGTELVNLFNSKVTELVTSSIRNEREMSERMFKSQVDDYKAFLSLLESCGYQYSFKIFQKVVQSAFQLTWPKNKGNKPLAASTAKKKFPPAKWFHNFSKWCVSNGYGHGDDPYRPDFKKSETYKRQVKAEKRFQLNMEKQMEKYFAPSQEPVQEPEKFPPDLNLPVVPKPSDEESEMSAKFEFAADEKLSSTPTGEDEPVPLLVTSPIIQPNSAKESDLSSLSTAGEEERDFISPVSKVNDLIDLAIALDSEEMLQHCESVLKILLDKGYKA